MCVWLWNRRESIRSTIQISIEAQFVDNVSSYRPVYRNFVKWSWNILRQFTQSFNFSFIRSWSSILSLKVAKIELLSKIRRIFDWSSQWHLLLNYLIYLPNYDEWNVQLTICKTVSGFHKFLANSRFLFDDPKALFWTTTFSFLLKM